MIYYILNYLGSLLRGLGRRLVKKVIVRPELHIKFVLNHFKDPQDEVGAVILNCLWSSTRKRYTSAMLLA